MHVTLNFLERGWKKNVLEKLKCNTSDQSIGDEKWSFGLLEARREREREN